MPSTSAQIISLEEYRNRLHAQAVAEPTQVAVGFPMVMVPAIYWAPVWMAPVVMAPVGGAAWGTVGG